MKIEHGGLSYMYKTFGCFQSLEQSGSPFDLPTIPALKPGGFVRWETLQLLLYPELHASILTEAVKKYDIYMPDGTKFPKSIPREVFPDKPDPEMQHWHEMVTGKLTEDQRRMRITDAPFLSPRNAPRDSVFGHRPRPSRGNSQDQSARRAYEKDRRRSSVPDLPSPFPGGLDASTHWTSDASTPHVGIRSPATGSHRPSSTHRTPDPYQRHPSSNRTANGSAQRRSSPNAPYAHPYFPPPPKQEYKPIHKSRKSGGSGHHRRRSPSTIDEFSSSGSEGSSEASVSGRPSANSKHNRESRHDNTNSSTLWPPLQAIRNHIRRHSHDATSISKDKDERLSRPNSSRRVEPSSTRPHTSHKHASIAPHLPQRNGNANVRFKQDMFDRYADDFQSAPESAAADHFGARQQRPEFRYWDSKGNNISRDTSSNSLADQGQRHSRKAGMPTRIHTVTGVGGRKYSVHEPRSAVGSPTGPARRHQMLSMDAASPAVDMPGMPVMPQQQRQYVGMRS